MDAIKLSSSRAKILIILSFLAIFQLSFFADRWSLKSDDETKDIGIKKNSIFSSKDKNAGEYNNTGKQNDEEKHDYHNAEKSITFEPFNHTNPYENSWCPTAECFNSPICTPCNQRFLFIIATGRSGSTTLLKMFNKLPNIRIAGENYNALYEAYKLSTFFDKHLQHFKDEESINEGRFEHNDVKEGPFAHNAIPIGSMSCVTQHFMRHLDPPELDKDGFIKKDEINKPILGAKLIRIQNGKWKPQIVAKFFKENFPCSRFIINIRSDMEDQLKSMSLAFKWSDKNNSKDLDMRKDRLENQNQFLFNLQKELGDKSSQLIDMSQWKDDVGVLNKMVSWLGFDGCAFDAIVHENHDRYGHDMETEVRVGDNCKMA